MAPRWKNYYSHDDCPVEPGVEWTDVWSCCCNDRCPACNAEIEPYKSKELPKARRQGQTQAAA